MLLAEEANVAGFSFKGQNLVSQSGYVGSTPSTNPSASGFTPNLSLNGTTGTIHARQGSIGGFELTKNYLQSTESGTGGNRNLILNGITGKLTANDATIKGHIEATSGSFPSSLMTGKLTADKINFNGATGTNVDLTGKITATSGTFSGSLSGATGTFKGTLSAATGTFSGELSAVTGAIGGFNITNSVLKSANNNLTLDAINALITAGSGNTRIEMGMKNTVPVLQFYKNGTLQYDLGPDGITLKGGDATINGTTSSTITLNNI